MPVSAPSLVVTGANDTVTAFNVAVGKSAFKKIALNGNTSGGVTLQVPDIAGTNTLTIPAATGNIVTTGDTGTVTNTMLAGSIANAKLANSSLTVNGTSISLGGSGSINTDAVGEGSTNLYYTDARARAAFSGGTGVTVSSGSISIGQAVNTTSNVTFSDLTVSGILTVNGTTTTVNSTITTIVDPIIDIGGATGGAAPSTDDAKDRGITFQWHNGTAAKRGFFGWDRSSQRLSFIPDATITSEVVSGTLGNIDISGVVLNGSTSGAITLSPAAVAGANTITFPAVTGNVVTTGDTGTVTNTMLAGSIANAKLTNSSVTVNGTAIALGGSGTITATATNALTIGTGLSGSSYNGSSAVTIALANTAVTAGSYTTANITVDAQGRLTAASSGTSSANTWAASQTFASASLSTTSLSTSNPLTSQVLVGDSLTGTRIYLGTVYTAGQYAGGYIQVSDYWSSVDHYERLLLQPRGGNVGIGTTTPGSILDVKGTLRLSGSTSGYVGLSPAAAAGSTTYTLPSADGTNGQVLSTNGSGTMSWTTISSGAQLSGTNTWTATQTFDAGIVYPNTNTSTVTNAFSLQIKPKVPSAAVGSYNFGASVNPQAIYVEGRYAYITVANTSSQLRILDISNPASPTLVSSTNIGANCYDIKVQGDYAYIISNTSAIMHVVDVSNPASPTIVNGTSSTGTATATSPYALDVAGRYAYVVNSAASPNARLEIFDISNPAVPFSVGTYTAGAGHRNVQVVGRYCFIGMDSANTFDIVDVSNPYSPVRAGFMGINNWYGFAVEGKYVYGISAGGYFMGAYDISNPASPNATAAGTLGLQSPRGIYVAGRYAYVMENAAGRIAIVDISNPASMTSIGTVTMNGGGNTPRTLAVQGRYLFYVSPSNTTLQCYDIHGAHVQHLESGTIESSYLLVKRDASFIGDIDTRGNLAVGENIFVHGRASAFQYKSASSGTSYTDPETNLLPMFYARNHSNSSTSAHAIMGLRVGGGSGGDPFVSFDIAGVTGWSLGVDNSDSDKFKIANSWSDVGTTTRLTIDTSGNVGINQTTPGSTLDVKGTLRLSGSTSGYVGFSPAAAAGSTTYTLPSADGTNGQVLSTNGSGTLSWQNSVSGSVSNVFSRAFLFMG